MRLTPFILPFLFLMICCFIEPIHSAGSKRSSIYYVDSQNGNDTNNGRTINSAWQTIEKVNTTSFQPGDQVLFKKGDVWFETLQISSSGTYTNPVIYGSYGPDGLPQPLIDGQLIRDNCIYHYSKNNIIIKNLSLQNATGSGAVRIMFSSNVTVVNCTFLVTGHGGVFIENSNNCIINKNSFTTPAADWDKQTDGIYSQRNSNNIYEKNDITISNSNSLQHIDGIQSYIDNDLTIRDNYICQENSKTNSQGIYITTGTGTHNIFNNIVVCPNTVASVLGFKNLTAGTATLRAYHNTLIGKGANVIAINGDPSPVVKNNIFVALSPSHGVIRVDSTCTNPSEINNNLYNNGGNSVAVTFKGQNITFAQWQALGFESAGLFADPLLDSNYTLAQGSPAVNKGFEIGNICAYDRAGTLRPQMGLVDIGAYESFYAGKVQGEEYQPAVFGLAQNYPNPFNPSTKIRFSIPQTSEISLKVYDMLGNEIAILAEGNRQAGNYEMEFNGSGLASGVYIYRLEAGSFIETKKMSMVK